MTASFCRFTGEGTRIIGVPIGRGTTFDERMSYDPRAACEFNGLDYRYEARDESAPDDEPVVTLD